MQTVKYNFYKEIEDVRVYRELLGDKYVVEIKEDGRTVIVISKNMQKIKH